MICLRPHHLLCNLCFQGEGYSDEFVENFWQLHNYLNANPDEVCIEIIAGDDDICSKCPNDLIEERHRCGDVMTRDQNAMQLLKVQVGEMYSLNQTKQKVRLMGMHGFRQLCSDCEWYINLCAPVIEKRVNI